VRGPFLDVNPAPVRSLVGARRTRGEARKENVMRFLMPIALVAFLAAAGCMETSSVRGPSGEQVTAMSPSSLVIHRGSSVPLTVDIDRQNFNGPVKVSLEQLPKGVSADRSSMKVESTSATFALKAKDDATLVTNQQVAVMIEAMDGRKAKQYVSLTVVE
jgi:hypothetical protein